MLLLWLLDCATQPTPAPQKPLNPPSILVITGCSWRAKEVGAYGAADSVTPHLDAFAQQSVLFENAYANATFTDASHASMFTGLYPSHEGMLDFGNVISPEAHTLPEIMALYDYRVHAFVDSTQPMHPIGLHNMTRGFGKAEELKADGLLAGVQGWVKQDLKPWLAWVHVRRSHFPYGEGPEFDASLHPAVHDWLVAQAHAAQVMFKPERRADGSMTEDPMAVFLGQLHHDPTVQPSLNAAYRTGLAAADAQFGEILDGLTAAGALQNTVVIVAGDHGESLGEGDKLGHQGILTEEVLRVPLMIRIPGGSPRRESALVSLVDVLPTITELTGQVAPAGLDGQSLVPALRAQPLATHPVLAQAIHLLGDKNHSRLANALIEPPYWFNSDAPGPQLLKWNGTEWAVEEDEAQTSKMDKAVQALATESMWNSVRPQLPEAVRKELQQRGYW